MSFCRNVKSFIPPVFGRATETDIRFIGNINQDVVERIETIVGYQHHDDLRLGRYVVSSFAVPEKASVGEWLDSIFNIYPGGIERFRSFSAVFDHMAPQVFDETVATLRDPNRAFTRVGVAELCAAVARYLGGVDQLPGSVEHVLSLEELEARWCEFTVTPETPLPKFGTNYANGKPKKALD